MKRFLLPLCMLFTPILYGQIAPDTDMFAKMYTIYEQTPIFLTEIPVKNFTLSSVYLNHQEGNLRLGQQPKEQTDFGLQSYGFYKHKEIRFLGRLNMQRIYQRNKAWNLSEGEVQANGLMPDPHYFAVSRPAPWVNQQYNIFGGVSLPLYQQVWSLSLSTHINYEEKFRETYDPRPKTSHNELHFAAQTALRIFPKHKIALSGEYGFNKMVDKMKFADENGQKPLNLTKYNRWQLGYGNFQLSSSSNNKRKNDYYGFALGYHYTGLQHKFLVEGSYRNTLTHTFLNANDSESDLDIIARLYEDTFMAKAHYLNQLKEDQVLSLSIIASQREASNRLVMRQGRSYRSYQEDITFSANLLKNIGTTTRELAFEAVYQGAYQKDIIAKTLTDHSTLALSLLWAKEYEVDTFLVRPTVKGTVIFPLYNKLINQNTDYHKPYSESDYAARTLRLFYEEVVYPDHEFFHTTRYQFSLGTDLKKRLSKQTLLITGIHSTYTTSFKGRDRYGAAISISLLK
ncbi:hypothetical protein CGC50_04100 [Capnocytophaga gingivalis]|uniref:DUF6850 domain-containing protein n=1 Tax=Capnocytophaga gingivalis TaxID=1017 RepID=A0A250FPU6_9FLAO|nr:DUF6850 family outer membrane beta-barrel protein [Capnocytophaga gingivalis]ATA86415.1 hypothetical protein CGC50_04100 [Capnocytophaga gingivalis]